MHVVKENLILIHASIRCRLGYILLCWTSIQHLTKYIAFIARLVQQSLIPEFS